MTEDKDLFSTLVQRVKDLEEGRDPGGEKGERKISAEVEDLLWKWKKTIEDVKDRDKTIDERYRRVDGAYNDVDEKTRKIVNEMQQRMDKYQKDWISAVDFVIELLNEGSDILLLWQQRRIQFGPSREELLAAESNECLRVFEVDIGFHRGTFIACVCVLSVQLTTRIIGVLFDFNERKGRKCPPFRKYKDGPIVCTGERLIAGILAVIEPNLANSLFYKKITKSTEIRPNKNTSWMMQDFYELYNKAKTDYAARSLLFYLFLLEDIPELCIEVSIWMHYDFQDTADLDFWIFLFSLVTTVVHMLRHSYTLWAARRVKNTMEKKFEISLDTKDLFLFDYSFPDVMKLRPNLTEEDLIEATVQTGVAFCKEALEITEVPIKEKELQRVLVANSEDCGF